MRATAQIIYMVACVALLGLAFFGLRWLIVGVDAWYGYGIVTGMAIMALLFWAAERLGLIRTVDSH